MFRSRRLPLAILAAAAIVAGWQVWSRAQQPAAQQFEAARSQPQDTNRFEFEVVQSFDAKYQGDTPGHIGRGGGLENRRPQIALGDAVYRGEQLIGRVTGLGWSPTHGSLEVEFSPPPNVNVRVSVGDTVWLALDGRPAAGR